MFLFFCNFIPTSKWTHWDVSCYFQTKPMKISHRFNFKWFHWNKKLMYQSYYTLISKPIVHSFKLPCNKHRNSAIIIIKIMILYANIRFGLAWEKINNFAEMYLKENPSSFKYVKYKFCLHLLCQHTTNGLKN